VGELTGRILGCLARAVIGGQLKTTTGQTFD